MSDSWYGDNDPFVCAWLRELIAAGHLPPGLVDERDIREVSPDDIRQYIACHFCAGIGGWPHALDLAGWPAARPVWTASLPCQPFSHAGKRKGQEDERHLWPVLLGLIRECRPATILGEQVASDDGYRWLARVRDDLEAEGYAVGCADLPACCTGAPHIRQRLFWVANLHGGGRQQYPERERGRPRLEARGPQHWDDLDGRCAPGRLGQPIRPGWQGRGASLRGEPGHGGGREPAAPTGDAGRVGDTQGGNGERGQASSSTGPGEDRDRWLQTPDRAGCSALPGPSFWDWSGIIPCRDGKWRRVEPGTFPLAHGVPARVGRLRGYGNAIVPQVAALFVRAFLDAEADLT